MDFKKMQLQLVTGNDHTQMVLAEQIKKYFGNSLAIFPYIIDDPGMIPHKDCFTVFSSAEVCADYMSKGYELKQQEYIIAQRIIDYRSLEKILFLPRDKEVLFINDSKDSAKECIEYLSGLGIDFIKFVPYYPRCKTDVSNISIGITAGERDKAPDNLSEIYDMGARIMDFSTIIKILERYEILDENIKLFSDIYTRGLMDFAKQMADVALESSRSITEIRRDLVGRGYYAKYYFTDIIGESDEMTRIKSIAQKLAKTDLSVLIEGEDGTGKELFASSIHNASQRAKQAFVAVNFSALPDELIESELFGYEEGAFTGAKKGGKTGLFKQADRGTIFLDEIGDASPKTQVKILRAIQEKEIMPIGGDRIIPIDVRIIAATNKDLKQMVKDNLFRKDLYYRLKEGCIKVLPLNYHKEDLLPLVSAWEKKNGINLKFDEAAIELLQKYTWPGNVRELYNLLKYTSAICDENIVHITDLPNDILKSSDLLDEDIDIERIVLNKIRQRNQKGEVIGRKKLHDELGREGYHFSEYRIRVTIENLLEKGIVFQKKGKYGLFTEP